MTNALAQAAGHQHSDVADADDHDLDQFGEEEEPMAAIVPLRIAFSKDHEPMDRRSSIEAAYEALGDGLEPSESYDDGPEEPISFSFSRVPTIEKGTPPKRRSSLQDRYEALAEESKLDSIEEEREEPESRAGESSQEVGRMSALEKRFARLSLKNANLSLSLSPSDVVDISDVSADVDEADVQQMVRQFTETKEPEEIQKKMVELVEENQHLRNRILELEDGSQAGTLDAEEREETKMSSTTRSYWQDAVGRVLNVRSWIDQVCFHSRDHGPGRSAPPDVGVHLPTSKVPEEARLPTSECASQHRSAAEEQPPDVGELLI